MRDTNQPRGRLARRTGRIETTGEVIFVRQIVAEHRDRPAAPGLEGDAAVEHAIGRLDDEIGRTWIAELLVLPAPVEIERQIAGLADRRLVACAERIGPFRAA